MAAEGGCAESARPSIRVTWVLARHVTTTKCADLFGVRSFGPWRRWPLAPGPLAPLPLLLLLLLAFACLPARSQGLLTDGNTCYVPVVHVPRSSAFGYAGR